jgi:hypothetical protein
MTRENDGFSGSRSQATVKRTKNKFSRFGHRTRTTQNTTAAWITGKQAMKKR